MKRLASVFLLFFILTIPFQANSAISVDGSVVSKYVWRGLDVLGDVPAIQPSVTYSLGETGFWVNGWGSFALTQRTINGDLDEVDFTAGYDRTLSNIGISLGVAMYNYPQVEDYPDNGSSNYEIFLSVTSLKCPLSPGLIIYYAMNEDAWDGLYASFSAGHSIEFGSNNLDLALSIGYSDQTLVQDSGISDINIGLSTTIQKENLRITPSFTLMYTPDDKIYKDQFIFWGGFNFGWDVD